MALLRLYGATPLRALARVYIDVFRSIPLLVLLVLVYYALPFVGVRLSSFAAAATALSMVSCAYTAEIFRAGIEALPKGQFEAAAAIGLNFFDTLRDVVLPQALRIVTPPSPATASTCSRTPRWPASWPCPTCSSRPRRHRRWPPTRRR